MACALCFNPVTLVLVVPFFLAADGTRAAGIVLSSAWWPAKHAPLFLACLGVALAGGNGLVAIALFPAVVLSSRSAHYRPDVTHSVTPLAETVRDSAGRFLVKWGNSGTRRFPERRKPHP